MSGILSRAGEAIRNSPLMTRKAATYSLANDDEDDPFARGITFHVEYQGHEDLPPSAGTGDKLNSSVIERINISAKPPFRQFSVLVTDKSLRLKDLTTKEVVDTIPIYNISFCGTSRKYDRAFSIIVKDPDSGRMRIRVMRAADRSKAQTMVVCVSKAFNIAYLAWQAQKKQKMRLDSAELKSADSPRAQRKMDELRKAEEKKKKAEEEEAKVKSVTEQMGAIQVVMPAIEPDELEDAFTNLARARSHPDLLETDVNADPAQFNWLDTKQHVDPGSTSNLLDI